MREGLKRRVLGPKPNTLTMVKQFPLYGNSFNKRVSNGNCYSNNYCEVDARVLQTKRKYKRVFRQPVKGWRKSLVGCCVCVVCGLYLFEIMQIKKIFIYEGGMPEWIENNYPVE